MPNEVILMQEHYEFYRNLDPEEKERFFLQVNSRTGWSRSTFYRHMNDDTPSSKAEWQAVGRVCSQFRTRYERNKKVN